MDESEEESTEDLIVLESVDGHEVSEVDLLLHEAHTSGDDDATFAC